MSGPELVRSKREVRPDLPVVLMSGFSRDELARNGVLPPDVPVLDKPFAGPLLCETIHKTLGVHRATEAALV